MRTLMLVAKSKIEHGYDLQWHDSKRDFLIRHQHHFVWESATCLISAEWKVLKRAIHHRSDFLVNSVE
jgi:hypothetical protein